MSTTPTPVTVVPILVVPFGGITLSSTLSSTLSAPVVNVSSINLFSSVLQDYNNHNNDYIIMFLSASQVDPQNKTSMHTPIPSSSSNIPSDIETLPLKSTLPLESCPEITEIRDIPSNIEFTGITLSRVRIYIYMYIHI
jgi:hypothetical protein